MYSEWNCPCGRYSKSPTVAGLAKCVEAAQLGDAALLIPPIEKLPKEVIPHLSYAQLRLWFVDRLIPGCAAYNVMLAIRLAGPLEEECVRQALLGIVRRHTPLRSTIQSMNGKPYIVEGTEASLIYRVENLASVPESDRWEEALNRAGTDYHCPFDLAKEPPLRAKLYRLDPSNHLLTCVIHHIACDHWSVGVMLREFTAFYAAAVQTKPAVVPPLPNTYGDYAAWQRNWLDHGGLQYQLDYWRSQLQGLSALNLPTDHPRPVTPTFRGRRHEFIISQERVDAIRRLGQRDGATLFMTLLAAFQTLLHRYSGQHDLAVGSPVFGRRRSELEGLVGYFVNMLVYRADLTGDPSFRTYLMRVRETVLGALAHQDLPFEHLVEDQHPERELARQPLFQAIIVLQNAPRSYEGLPGLSLQPVNIPFEMAKFDLSLLLTEEKGGLHACLETSADLYDASTGERIAGHFQTLLAGIQANPDAPLSALPVLTGHEYSLLQEWNATDSEYPRTRSVHDLFEEQARIRPDSVTLIADDKSLTYDYLNRCANQIAHLLRHRGANPGDVIGLCLPRGIDMITATLAILKAGCAYLPLDPGWPSDRLGSLLQDARSPLVLTHAALAGRLRGLPSLSLDAERKAIAVEGEENLPAISQELAYVMFTSGSTGQPKGVAVRHRSIVRLVRRSGLYRSRPTSDHLATRPAPLRRRDL